jgi:hypothetical protein
LQQARVGVVRGRMVLRRMGLGRFDGAEHLLRRDQKVNVIQVITFGWV